MRRRRQKLSELREMREFERVVGEVFYIKKKMFIVSENSDGGCEGCSLYKDDSFPCLRITESGRCSLRDDRKSVIFKAVNHHTDPCKLINHRRKKRNQ